MTTYFSKRISFALLIAIFSFSIIYADGGYERGGPIIILPIDTVKPIKPWSPSYINLTAFPDETGVVVMSNVDDDHDGIVYWIVNKKTNKNIRCATEYEFVKKCKSIGVSDSLVSHIITGSKPIGIL